VLEGAIFTYLLYSKDIVLYGAKGTDRGASGQLADRVSTWGQLGSLLTSICVLSLDGKWRDELAGGTVIEGAEAAGQPVVAQAVLAIG
jgi:hypothetical protein